MRNRFVIASWLLWCTLAGALPAYANNFPTPDGVFGLLLIIPLVILGLHFAGVTPTEKEKKRRIVNGVVLTLCLLATATGTAGGPFALVGLVYVVVYAIARGIRIIRRGQGKKRLALGLAIILFTPFAISNLLLSTEYFPRRCEPYAISTVGTIVTAEKTFRSNSSQEKGNKGTGKYASLEQLIQARLIYSGWVGIDLQKYEKYTGGYRFVVVLSGDPARDSKEFFVYATPLNYSRGDESGLWYFVPGRSWVAALHPIPPRARFTFASDESGVIREADLGVSRAVTREEAQKWQPLPP